MAAGALKLALFGHPVANSLSPRIHQAFAARAGLDIDYRAVDCPAGELAARFESFAAGGGRGANLTVPVKREGLALADSVSPAANAAGAVNTLVRTATGWHADNTDGAGLLADLDRLGAATAGRRILIIGAGGAVAGMLGALVDRQPQRVCLLNRGADRAQALAARFRGAPVDAHGLDQGPPAGGFDLLIQATSLGHSDRTPAIDPDWLAPGAQAYDLNYGRAHRPFAEWCRSHGLDCHDGLGMLVEQAAGSFELWTGHRPETGPVLGKVNRETVD